jgi:hypothetical protein
MNFPVAQGVFETHGAFPGLRGLGKLAQIGDLGQVEIGQIVDQVCDMRGAGGVGHGGKLQQEKIDDVAFRIIWRSVSELNGVMSWHARAERSVRSSS